MSWTPWINIEPDSTSITSAKRLYDNTRHPITGEISDLTRITSLTPGAADLIHKLCQAVFDGADGLTIREKEIAALVTSTFNGCVH